MTSGGMQPHPDALYYHIAANAVQTAAGEARVFQRKQAVTVAMVFAVLCLEAYVNKQKTWDENVSLVKKWRQIPSKLGAEEGFRENEEPFHTFKDLVHTRNHRLVHFKPKGETHFIGMEPDRRYFGDLIADVGLAQQYVECVRAMIVELNRLTAGKSELPRFLAGEEYLSTVWTSVTIPYEVLGPKRD